MRHRRAWRSSPHTEAAQGCPQQRPTAPRDVCPNAVDPDEPGRSRKHPRSKARRHEERAAEPRGAETTGGFESPIGIEPENLPPIPRPTRGMSSKDHLEARP